MSLLTDPGFIGESMEKLKRNHALILILLTLFIPAISIMLHEVGHYIFGLFYGFTDSKIYFAMTLYAPRSIDITLEMSGILAFGGPLSSIIQVLMAFLLIHKGSNNPLLYGFVIFPQTQVLRNLTNITMSEEYRFGSVLPMPDYTPWILSLAIFILAITFMVIISIRRRKLIQLGLIIPVLIVGFILWIRVIGPIVMAPN